MMLPLAHFSVVLLLKEQVIISAPPPQKNVKNAGQINAKPIDF